MSLSKEADPRKALTRILQQRARRLDLSREIMAALVNDAASQMSRLMNGHQEFSTERLLHFTTRLGGDVEIRVRFPKPRLGRRGRVAVKEVRHGR